MKILFLTQSKTLAVFYNVMQTLKASSRISGGAFYIADSDFYNKFRQQNPEISSGNYELLKEWEIIRDSQKRSPDMRLLAEYEKRLGDPVLWNALLADRRIYLGKNTTVEQDYSSRFSHEQMLAILQTGIEKMEETFDRVKPDAVTGFICVTIGEYLAYLVARARNIPFLDLRPTRIKNYFFAGESVHEPSEILENTFRNMLSEGIPSDRGKEAESYLEEVRSTHAMYEGVLPAGAAVDNTGASPVSRAVSAAAGLGSRIKKHYDYTQGEFRHDNHYVNIFYSLWVNKVKKPLRIKYIDRSLRDGYIDEHRLASTEYVFYPLHKEPEVTLLVYGRPFMNQIEVIRNTARSLPVGMKLIVKEHPASVGYRPLSYYKKILAIPNVLMAPPEMPSRILVQNSRMVTIVSGSVGLEALMMKKPVLHFGNVPFSMLPDNMIRRAADQNNIARDINDLMKNHYHDEEALIAYLSSVMMASVPINFYSALLGRSGVYLPDGNIEYSNEIEKLAAYLTNCLNSRLTKPRAAMENKTTSGESV